MVPVPIRQDRAHGNEAARGYLYSCHGCLPDIMGPGAAVLLLCTSYVYDGRVRLLSSICRRQTWPMPIATLLVSNLIVIALEHQLGQFLLKETEDRAAAAVRNVVSFRRGHKGKCSAVKIYGVPLRFKHIRGGARTRSAVAPAATLHDSPSENAVRGTAAKCTKSVETTPRV